uniref:Nudix hydrolase domain-containing protein n=1 Tax=Kalanchoe fedtschenkoi TaxID=63787 RepID=A0A7N0SW08_KALFE
MEEAAQRETSEEAGVAGELDRERLGKWCYKGKTNGISHEGYMYPLFVTDQSETWPEKNTRIRIWMKVDEARASNMPSWMKQALEALIVRLQNPLRRTVQNGTINDLVNNGNTLFLASYDMGTKTEY